MEKERWTFRGIASSADRTLTRKEWVATTMAESPKKAITNLKYRIRNECRLPRYVPLTLSGRLYSEFSEVIEF